MFCITGQVLIHPDHSEIIYPQFFFWGGVGARVSVKRETGKRGGGYLNSDTASAIPKNYMERGHIDITTL